MNECKKCQWVVDDPKFYECKICPHGNKNQKKKKSKKEEVESTKSTRRFKVPF